jgi:PTH1 family peptidyl-tRNA hydrolase
MWLIIGLGNIGEKYIHTRHNAGWKLLDALSLHINATPWRSETRFCSHICEAADHKTKLILAKPSTFMNLSGDAVTKLMAYYKVPIDRVMVLQDDLDLPFGVLRKKLGGGHGGQNGVRDIILKTGEDGFVRIKMGILNPLREHMDASNFVLSAWNDDEKLALPSILKTGIEKILDTIHEPKPI